VGPADFTFRNGRDVIRGADIPDEFAAVLSGHIHRHQVLHCDLMGRPLGAPVLYPGSLERTAFAEVGEDKGYLLLEVGADPSGGRLLTWDFIPLPTRPMVAVDLHPPRELGNIWTRSHLEAGLKGTLASVPRDSVLRVRLHGRTPEETLPILTAPQLRSISPPEMNLQVLQVEGSPGGLRGRRPLRTLAQPAGETQSDLWDPGGA
jgi:DNA repair exonuclease SbcCD nuclease subunit